MYYLNRFFLRFFPQTRCPAVESSKRTMWTTLKRIFPYIWSAERKDLNFSVLIAMTILVFSKIFSVIATFSFKLAFDTLENLKINSSDTIFSIPVLLIIAYGASQIIAVLLAQIRDSLFARVGQHAVRKLALSTFKHLHALSLRFHLDRRTGGLSKTIDNGVKGIETIVRHGILNIIPTVLEILFIFFIFLFYFSFHYFFIIVITMFLYLLFTFVVSEKRIVIRKEMNESDTEANAKAIDSLLNFETIKYFNNESWEASRFEESMARYERASIKIQNSLSLLNLGQAVIFNLGLTMCRVMAIIGILDNQFTIGDFVMMNALLMQIHIPLNFAGTIYRDFKQGLTDIEGIFSLLEIEPEVKDLPNAKPLKITKAEISFENVSFGYFAHRPILKNISFFVPSGKKVAIVGSSGAGKSTLARLLFRFYDVTGGKILIDGQDISQVTQESLRSAIGIVPQDAVLFNETLGYNIRYGCFDADPSEVEHVAALSQLEGFVSSCPAGYETVVGERGLKLSGGEKQRLAIARVVLKDPPILVLDEATSALDTRTERDIQSSLSYLIRQKTTLIIAHRLSTIVDCDQIIVLADGEIVERGSHEELLAMKGLYADMWFKQPQPEVKTK